MNTIGIDKTKANNLAEMLNDLLANYQVFYTNVRGFHWNIKGEKFFELHAKFEELYDDLNMKIDEIAERILTLGLKPEHAFSKYLNISEITEASETSDGTKDVQRIVNSFSVLIQKQRSILDTSGDAGDEGTNSLMSDYIREQEKLVWMYTAFLNNN
jgi:starvation-inducible DNA-binding protein